MRRVLAIAFIATVVPSGAAFAADENAARELRPPKRGYAIQPAPMGLRLTTPAFGLRLEFEPPANVLEPYPRAPSYESPFRAGSDHSLRFWRWDLGQSDGWSAFGMYGPMRFSKEFRGDSDTTLRFGGTPIGAPGEPDRLNLGIRYRYRF